MKHFVLILFTVTSAGLVRASDSITLSDYLREVESHNLTLRANSAVVDAADARSVGVKLPPPMVGISQMSDTSGSAKGYEITQMIPFPTKLTSDRKARKLEAQAEKTNATSVKKEVLAQARLIYIGVWAAQQKIVFLKDKRSAIQQHLRLSRASTRSDSSLTIHTLKAESDLDLLDNEILEAEQMQKEQQIALAEYAQRGPMSYRPVVTEPPMSAIPEQRSLSEPSQLEVKRLEVAKLEARISEAHSSWFPDFSVRYRDIGGTPMTRGFREVMVGATIPFAFFWEPRAASKSAQAEKLRAEAEYSQEKLRVTASTASLSARAQSLKKQIDLIVSKLLPRAEKRMNLVHNLAPRDMESIQEHREGMEAFPDLKLKALDLRMQFESTVAELAKFQSEAAQ